MEQPETLFAILPSGLFEWDALRFLLVGVEPAGESPTAASEPTGEEDVPEEPAASAMDVDDGVVEDANIENRGTNIKEKIWMVDHYLKMTVLVNLDRIED